MAIIGIGQYQPVQLRTGESNPRLVQVSDQYCLCIRPGYTSKNQTNLDRPYRNWFNLPLKQEEKRGGPSRELISMSPATTELRDNFRQSVLTNIYIDTSCDLSGQLITCKSDY
jgi:hypothetical protein